MQNRKKSVFQDIILRLHNMSHKQIIFCWLPSHVGIRGNEKADKKAVKSALSLKPSNLKLPYTDLNLQFIPFKQIAACMGYSCRQ